MNTTFLTGLPGRSVRERVVWAIAFAAPCLGGVAGILIDWKRQDVYGGVIESPLARGVFFTTCAVAALCFILFLCFRFLGGKCPNPPLQRTPGRHPGSDSDASGPASLS